MHGGQAVSIPATVDFNPGGALTPQSRTLVQEGLELDVQALSPPVAGQVAGGGSLVNPYRQQQHRGAVWIQSPCAPFINPLRGGLRPLGVWVYGGHRLQVFRGNVRSLPGSPGLLSSARVWVVIRADRRVRFEWLQRRQTPLGNPPLRTIAERFTYPTHHLDQRFAASSAADRARFYSKDYSEVLATLRGLEAFAGATDAGGAGGHAVTSGGGLCGVGETGRTATAGLAGAQGSCSASAGRARAAAGTRAGSRRSFAGNAGQRS